MNPDWNRTAVRRIYQTRSPVRISDESARRAAVALNLCQARRQPRVLLIERARRLDDPWSGQMGLPGGMMGPGDSDLRATAQRETREELALELGADEFLGRLDDQQGRHAGHPLPIVIAGFLYWIECQATLRSNYEVANYFWVPLNSFLQVSNRVRVRHPLDPDALYPGVRLPDLEGRVVWGLTYRFLQSFFESLGQDFNVAENTPVIDLWTDR